MNKQFYENQNMNSRQKIAKVLKEIKNESEISPNPKYVEFKFYPDIICVCDGLNDDEKKKILLKLQKEKVIKIHLPSGRNEEEYAMLSCYAPEEFILENSSRLTLIEILPSFDRKYWFYKFYLNGINYWNFVNPLWWIWKVILLIVSDFSIRMPMLSLEIRR